ncbi:MAG: hypothetical protein WC503_03365 [Candidatus Shapirobacteria bacterium]
MKKYFPVILLIATLTLSACGTAKTNTDSTTNTENKTNTEETKTTESKSLKDLLGLGTSQKCTYETNNDGEIMKGEIIISGKKFKQTTEISNKDGMMKVHAVSDGVYFYSWSDISKEMGTKMKIEDLEKEGENMPTVAETTGAENQNKINMNEKIDYKCSPATLTDNDLAIPTDVKFVDFTEMMKGLQNMDLEQFKKLAPQE